MEEAGAAVEPVDDVLLADNPVTEEFEALRPAELERLLEEDLTLD